MKYLCDPQIIPAVVPQSVTHLEMQVDRGAAFAQWIHIDFNDGEFASPKNWPIEKLDALPRSKASYEVHLMMADPETAGIEALRMGAKRIVAHLEACADEKVARASLRTWKKGGAEEVGLALLIGTPLDSIAPLVNDCDFIQLMSIGEIGHQGERFDERALSRVEELHARYPDLMVSVDGGIDERSVESLVRAGANRLVIGHALSASSQPEKDYANIHARAMKGCAPLRAEVAV